MSKQAYKSYKMKFLQILVFCNGVGLGALLDFLLYFCGNLLAALLPVSYCNCPFTVL